MILMLLKINYLTQQLRVPAKQIILYGRSVGGGPAIDLASRQKVGGLVVESSFVSAFWVLTRIPILPFDKFVNIDKIRKVRSPVLVIHGKADEVVHFWHGEQLFAAAKQPKLNFWVDGPVNRFSIFDFRFSIDPTDKCGGLRIFDLRFWIDSTDKSRGGYHQEIRLS